MPNDSAPHITPQMPPDWSEAALDALGAFPKSLQFVLARWKEGSDVRGLNVLGTMAHYPALTKAFMTFNAHVAGASTLSARVRELAILRLSWLLRSEYELVQHIILGLRAGLTDAEIERTQAGPDAPGWSAEDADLLRAVDELHAQSGIQKTTLTQLAGRFSNDQLMDLVFLMGCYTSLGWAINSFSIALDPDATPLAPQVRARLLKAKASISN